MVASPHHHTTPGTASIRLVARAWCLAAITLALPALAHGSCNVIPAPDRSILSELGRVSQPFASPGDRVVIRRSTPAFALDGCANRITVATHGIALNVEGCAETTNIPDCPPCESQGCYCVAFGFPDTDAHLGAPTDGVGLAGAATVDVTVDDRQAARVGKLFTAPEVLHDRFPAFLALPRPNRITTGGNAVWAAVSPAGDLLIPADFSDLLPKQVRETHLIDVVAPLPVLDGIAGESVQSFTQEGAALPPIITPVGPDGFSGTADSPRSVLRIEHGASRLGLAASTDGGAVLLPQLSVRTGLGKHGDVLTIASTPDGRHIVYETREAWPAGVGAMTAPRDLNGDGDMRDYLLYALDVSRPGRAPTLVHELDVCDATSGAAGCDTPCSGQLAEDVCPEMPIHRFLATNELIVFEVADREISDVDYDGRAVDLVASGIFDLTRGRLVDDAAGTPSADADGALAAFAWRDGNGGRFAAYYDARLSDPGPFLLVDSTGDPFPLVTNPQLDTIVLSAFEPAVGIAVGGERLAFALARPDSPSAVVLVEPSIGIAHEIAWASEDGILRLTEDWLALVTANGVGGMAMAVLRTASPHEEPTWACDTGSTGAAAEMFFSRGSSSNEIIPCLRGEGGPGGGDVNGDGDTIDHVLQAFAPGARDFHSLNRALDMSPVCREQEQIMPVGIPIVNDRLLAFAVDETQDGRDVDGDQNLTCGPPAPLMIARRDDASAPPIHPRGLHVSIPAPPFYTFNRHGMTVVDGSVRDGQPRRIFLLDMDADGRFEEPLGTTGELDDNCPRVANPDQVDLDADGVGDACDPIAACPASPIEHCQETAMPGSRLTLIDGLGRRPDRVQARFRSRALDVESYAGAGGARGFELCVYSGADLVRAVPFDGAWKRRCRGESTCRRAMFGTRRGADRLRIKLDARRGIRLVAEGALVDLDGLSPVGGELRAQLIAPSVNRCLDVPIGAAAVSASRRAVRVAGKVRR